MDQTYRTAVSNNHNSQQLKLYPSHLETDKSSQSCAKIALRRNNCVIAGKVKSCAIFPFFLRNFLGGLITGTARAP